MIITPGILRGSYEEVVRDLFLLEGVTERVQIDLCDGRFGLEKTWLPYRETHLPEGFSYEFDLMVTDWRKYVPRVIALNAKRIVVHVDDFSYDDLLELVEMVRKANIYLGMCVSNDYNVPNFVQLVHFVESHYTRVFIQIMGIKRIGAQGQPFDEGAIRRVAFVKDRCRNIDIQVDGAMNPETIFKVKEAGARTIVVGSYIFGGAKGEEEIRATYQKLCADWR